MNNTQELLTEMVQDLANELSNGFDEDRLTWEDEPMTPADYIAESLDITYHVSGNGDFKGGEIAVTIGGPNIYVNITERRVEGYWGGDMVSRPFVDTVGLWDTMSEIYEMTRFF